MICRVVAGLFGHVSTILRFRHSVFIHVVAIFIRFCKYVLYFSATLVFVVLFRFVTQKGVGSKPDRQVTARTEVNNRWLYAPSYPRLRGIRWESGRIRTVKPTTRSFWRPTWGLLVLTWLAWLDFACLAWPDFALLGLAWLGSTLLGWCPCE